MPKNNIIDVNVSITPSTSKLSGFKDSFGKVLEEIFTKQINSGAKLFGKSLGLISSNMKIAVATKLMDSGIFVSALRLFPARLRKFFDSKIVSAASKSPHSFSEIKTALKSGTNVLMGGILGIVSNLKPVKTILSTIGAMFNLIFLPIGLIMMAFLFPVLSLFAAILSSGLFQSLLKYVSEFVQFMAKLNLNVIVTALGKGWKFLADAFANGAKAIVTDIVNAIMKMVNFIINLPQNFAKAIGNFFAHLFGGLNPVGDISKLFAGITHLASGGVVTSSGMAIVHAGETVIPKNTNIVGGHTFNISINNTGSTIDPKKLVDGVISEIERRVGRLQRW
ncbi:MAG: hypothetical protein QXL94_00760 [Candidatus Parvarchaeum sp.]